MPITTASTEKDENKHNSDGNKSSETTAAVSSEFKKFLADIEDLVKATNLLTGEELAKAKDELNKRFTAAKASMSDVSSNITEKAKKTAAYSNTYVHEKPWQAICGVSVIGFLVGYLLARRG